MFYHNHIWFVVQVGVHFLSLKPGQPMLFSELSTNYSMLRQSRARFSRVSISPKGGACSNFFYSSPSAHSDEHLETHEVSKKFARSSFHTQEITPGTIVFQIFNNIIIIRQ